MQYLTQRYGSQQEPVVFSEICSNTIGRAVFKSGVVFAYRQAVDSPAAPSKVTHRAETLQEPQLHLCQVSRIGSFAVQAGGEEV